ncbi:pyruvoyl-dependent arginine decarboxylase [Bacteroidota bacterium]
MIQIELKSKKILKPVQKKGFYTGNRIPVNYFETSGTGESDIAIHAGSYHLALKSANIEMCNIITYSSILPGIASRTARPNELQHGCVLESIMSVCNAGKGEIATAGIIYAWLYDRRNGSKYGGLVCEHEGNYDRQELERRLKGSLDELYYNGFEENYYIEDARILSESLIPRKAYGTALTALCFTSYYHPVIHPQQ